MARKSYVPTNLLALSSDPANGQIGDVYFNTTTQSSRVYTTSGWVDQSGPTGPTGATGPAGPTGPAGEVGPTGPIFQNVDAGSPTSSYGGAPVIDCGGVSG